MMACRNIDTSPPFMTEFLKQAGGIAVIDGGLATELERHGADLNDPLWSAKCLLTSPHLIRSVAIGEELYPTLGQVLSSAHHFIHLVRMRDHFANAVGCYGTREGDPRLPLARVHLDYLEAGADIIITASYQATIQGFEAKGFSRETSEALLRKSVEIACEARDTYYQICKSSCGNIGDCRILKHRPILVAASVGSFGAYLADGSEYSGQYGDAIKLEVLKDFHRQRIQVLTEAGADLIAFETIPNKIEAQAYAELLEEEDIKIPAWFSFNSKDGINVVSGDSLLECASIAESCRMVVAVGINCTPPRFIHELILEIKKVTKKPIVIYPNSGESYDPDRKEWVENTGVRDEDFVSYVNKWCEIGASLVGGCCRTTPNTIRAIHRTLSR